MAILNKFIPARVGYEYNGVKISSPDENNPHEFTFKLSNFQGFEFNKGMNGYINMLGIRDAIIDTIKYLKDEHYDFLIESMTAYNKGEIDKASPKALFSDMEDNEFNLLHEVRCEHKMFDQNYDSVAISHSSSISMVKVDDGNGGTKRETVYPSRSLDNTDIKIRKWQGDCENGVEGMVRLLAIQNGIERAACTLNLTFGMHQEAAKIMGVTKEKTKESSLSR